GPVGVGLLGHGVGAGLDLVVAELEHVAGLDELEVGDLGAPLVVGGGGDRAVVGGALGAGALEGLVGQVVALAAADHVLADQAVHGGLDLGVQVRTLAGGVVAGALAG